ncbi:SNARE associated protein [Emticicia oligotrophica DSM 17448]|uniref:SNARE associated protein n=1 Tax=Emticicia oligotrophica (strain DSM 17448 / CIP 109782 / MTCC 6937 / GPTSA100-15) TaxID=929562 RepID=A0ABN4ADJ3_EMTOG|nr:DedA family protein [Emticicia oligotrophica]AFK01561.1 SNARE associated protein [Emticicia oligotrophica DSM 17448]
MEQIQEWFRYLMDSEELIRTGGLITITLIIFIENGIIFGFFLPGDYLLFLSGVFCGTKLLDVPASLLMLCVFLAAVLGSLLGYLTGRFFGENIQTRRDSLLFKKKYISNTHKYFEKYGSQTLIIARFLPVVRTFSPILAGIVKMNFYKFMLYNVIGGFIWTIVLVGGGFYFGEKFPWIVDYVQYIIFFFLAVTTFTVIKGYINAKRGLQEDIED